MKKMAGFIGALLMVGAVATACGGSSKKAETTPTTAPASQPAGGEMKPGGTDAAKPANPCG